MDAKINRTYAEKLVEVQEDLRSFIASMMPFDAGNVDDVLQETSLALLRHEAEYNVSRPFKAWAIGFAKLQIQAHRNGRHRERLVFDSELAEKSAGYYCPEETAENERREASARKSLAICKERLTERQRALIDLRYNGKMPIGEIAKKMHNTGNNVKVALFYTRKKLAECVQRLCRIAKEDDAPEKPLGEFDSLVSGLVEGERLSAAQRDAFWAELAKGENTLETYLGQMRVHLLLGGSLPAVQTASRARPTVLAAAAALAALATGFAFLRQAKPAPHPAPIAQEPRAEKDSAVAAPEERAVRESGQALAKESQAVPPVAGRRQAEGGEKLHNPFSMNKLQTGLSQNGQEKQMNITNTVKSAAAATAAITMASFAEAGEIICAGSNGPLTEAASWIGGVAPSNQDVAVWDEGNGSLEPFEHPLDADAAWGGILATNMNPGVKFSLIGTNTLTLGAGGIIQKEYSDATCPIVLAADQTWQNINKTSTSVATYYGTVSGPYTLTLTNELPNSYSVFYAPIEVSQLNISHKAVFLRENAKITCPVTIYDYHTLAFDFSTNVNWSERMPAICNNLNGIFQFGRYDFFGPQKAGAIDTLNAGDSIGSSDTSFSRSTGRIAISGHNVVNNGASIPMRWVYGYNGSYTQYTGNVSLRFDFIAGLGDSSTLKVKKFAFNMAGGTFAARRFEVGHSTSSAAPAVAEFSGGESTFTGDPGYSGLSIAMYQDSITEVAASRADGRLLVSGGKLTTHGICFGAIPNHPETAIAGTGGYAEVLLTGGELYLGQMGLRPSAEKWLPTADGTSTWYSVRLAGGTLGSFHNEAAVTAVTRLVGTNTVIKCADKEGNGFNITFAASLVGEGGFTKTGSGALFLRALNTYTGKTTITQGTLMVNTPETRQTVVPDATVAPAPTYTWTGDSLGAAGSSVTAWAPSNAPSSTPFIYGLAKVIESDATAPVVSMNAMNGHKTVAFDGSKLTGIGVGQADQSKIMGNPTSMTWTVVFRTPTEHPLFSTVSYTDNNNIIGMEIYSSQKWGIGLRSDGCVCAGMGGSTGNLYMPDVVAAPQRDTRFNEPHVAFFTWTASNNTFSVCVDGYTQSKTVTAAFSQFLSSGALVIGMNDDGQRNSPHRRDGSHFTGEIAEMRFYKNVALTEEQRKKVGRELAETYGADTYAYLSDAERANIGLASKEIEVVSPGILKSYTELHLGDGQQIYGSGQVTGRLVLDSGAVLNMESPNNSLTVTNLTLNSGASLRWMFNSPNMGKAITCQDITLNAGTNRVQIVSKMEKPYPSGVLFKYTGKLVDNGAVWQVIGGRANSKVVIDPATKTVRLVTSRGTVVMLM